MKKTTPQGAQDLPSTYLFGTGKPIGAGCEGRQALHKIYDLLGDDTIFVNSADCPALPASYPVSPFRSTWLYTAMASTPAGAEGVRTALDILKQQGKLSDEQDPQVVVVTGDNAAYGAGLSATSGAIERKLDFLYLCHDSDSYNIHNRYRPVYPGHQKDLFDIWIAHKPAYVATATIADARDLEQKIEKAKTIKGPRLILLLAPCPSRWDYDPKDTQTLGELAVKTGAWPLKEYISGRVVHNKPPHKREPVEAYLQLQGRFRHLFEPIRDDRSIMEMQSRIDRYWQHIDNE